MRLSDVAIQCFDVKGELAKVLRLHAANLQLNGHKAVQFTLEEQQVEAPSADLHWKFRSDPAARSDRAQQIHSKILQH